MASRRSRWGLALRFVVTAGLIGFLVVNYLPLELLRASGWQLAPALLMGLLLLLATLMLASVRWYLIGRTMDVGLGLGRTTGLIFIGQFFNQVLPTSFGGDAIRAWGAWTSGLTVREAVTSVTLDRLAGLIALGMLIALGLPILAVRLQNPWLAIGGAALVLAMPAGIMLLAGLSTSSVLQGDGRLRAFLRALCSGIAALVERPRDAAGILLLSLLVHGVAILLTVEIANALGSPIGLIDGVLILPSVLFISSLPISIAGWGVREAGLAGGFLLLGFPPEGAVATSILVGMINIAAGLPGAALFLLEKNRPQLRAKPS